MVRYCFVPGCSTSIRFIPKGKESKLKNQEKRHLTMFTPKNEKIAEEWNKAIGRPDKQMRKIDTVCELHFHEKDISRYFELKLKNGSTFRLKREIPRLLPNAIPSKNISHTLEESNDFENINSTAAEKLVAIGKSSDLENIDSTISEKQVPLTMSNAPENIDSTSSEKEVQLGISNAPENIDSTTSEKEVPLGISNAPENIDSTTSEKEVPLGISNAPENIDLTSTKKLIALGKLNDLKNIDMTIAEKQVPPGCVFVILPRSDALKNLDSTTSEKKVTGISNAPEYIDLTISEQRIKFNYKTLLNNINSIKFSYPGDSWGVSNICELGRKFIIFTKWRNLQPDRWITIDENLDTKAFIQGKKIDVSWEINSVDDITSMIKEFNFYILCAGIDEHGTKCLKIAQTSPKKGRNREYCTECSAQRHRDADMIRKRLKYAKK